MSGHRLFLVPAAAIALSSCGWFHSGNGKAIRLSGNMATARSTFPSKWPAGSSSAP